MKRIVIVRHAKAVHYGYSDDFNRDLQERGRKDAYLVSSELKKRSIYPEAIISSPAKRAFKTASIFAENLDFEIGKIQQMGIIYDGLDSYQFLKIVSNLPENINTVFFFGHNPDFHSLTRNLLKFYGEDMPTSATVGIEFGAEKWKDVKMHEGKQAFRIIPKMLKSQ